MRGGIRKKMGGLKKVYINGWEIFGYIYTYI